mmetsp:Transcript_27014/g.64516  ORF Transcript_27014/g.64516 Transcript_27014/m.64516 type:complete len:1314 (+) Transcript_27014:531-4472(+)
MTATTTTTKTAMPVVLLSLPLRSLRLLRLMLLLLLLSSTTLVTVHIRPVNGEGAYQSGPNVGSLFSGGFSASNGNEDVLVTGISYSQNSATKADQPSCFVATLDSSALQNPIPAAIIGQGNVLEACHSVDYLVHSNSNPRVVVVGTSDPGGLYGFEDQGSAFVMSLDPSRNFKVVNGLSLDDTSDQKSSYPVKVTADETTSTIFTSMSTSTDLELNVDAQTKLAEQDGMLNWLSYRKYGTSFFMSLSRVDYDQGSDTLVQSWYTEFPITPLADGSSTTPTVYVAGHIYKHAPNNPNAQSNYDLLVVAGSTRGMGVGYGNAEGNDEDGYLTLVDPTSGQLVNLNNGAPTSQDSSVSNLPAISLSRNNERIGTAQDDIITGICDDPSDDDGFFVVGATDGGGAFGDFYVGVDPANTESLQGWISKRKLTTLKSDWAIQWGAYNPNTAKARRFTSVVAMSCLVDATNGYVYVAGIVEDGATVMVDGSLTTFKSEPSDRPNGADPSLKVVRESGGGKDIWVAQLNKSTGDINWVQQVGSAGDETLAGGGGLGFDDNLDLIVMGDTTGPMYRGRDVASDTDPNDMFLMTLKKNDGSFDTIGQAIPATPTSPPIDAPTPPPATTATIDVEDGTATLDEALGLQSGPLVGPSYAGAMVYDPNADPNMLYLIGITYDPTFDEDVDDDTTLDLSSRNSSPTCAVAKIPIDEKDVVYWDKWDTFGSPTITESCNSIALHRGSELVVVGNGVDGSQFLLNTNQGATPGPAGGFAVALSRSDLSSIDSHALLSSTPDNKILYPIDVLSEGNDVYVVSLASTDSAQSSGVPNVDSPNWIINQQYGSSWVMAVTKLSLREETIAGISDGGITFNQVWYQEFPIEADALTGQSPRVHIGGSFLSGNILAIAGSTRGLGDAYGAAVGDDEDGFLTVLNTETGDFSSDVSRNTRREGSDKDDIVTGICPDANDSSVFYIVGATEGVVGTQLSTLPMNEGSMQGFLRKINVDGLSEVWTVQLGAVPQHDAIDGASTPTLVYARDCAVSGDVIYWGGDVLGEGGMVVGNDVRASYGGDDMWLAQSTTKDGSINWLHQVGSPGNDHMAPYNGVVATRTGSAVVFGDTSGPVFRPRRVNADNVDWVILTFEKTKGSYGDLTGTFEEVTQSQPSVPPTDPPVGAPTANVNIQPVALQPTTDIPPNAWEGAPSEGLSTGAIFGIIFGLAVVFGIICGTCGWFSIFRRGGAGRKRSGKDIHDEDLDFSLEKSINKDGLIVPSGNGHGYKDKPSWSSASSSSGGLGGSSNYTDEPLGGPNLQVGGFSDNLKNNGKEVI